MRMTIKALHIYNFKGIKEKSIEFGDKTSIKGANATGKTTIFDAFTWLLFNKNSQDVEKFDVRPLDAVGKQIDNVEIKVVAKLDVDGKEMELSKVQKQNWVKKRGTDTSVLQGNVNAFDVDGYPKSEKEFGESVATLIGADLFKMLTNPQYFAAMKWKDQRNILMKLVSDVSDLEFAMQNPAYADLIPELEKAPSTDDIKNKFQKALTEWKKKQVEIPVRIDELSKQKVDIDVAEQEIAKNGLTEKISECDAKLKSGSKVVDDLEQQKFELQFEINDCKRKANDLLVKERREIENRQYEANNKFTDLHQKISIADRGIAEKKAKIESLSKEKDELGKQYFAKKDQAFDETPYFFDESKWVFDESSTVCSMCGQTLPADKIEALKVDFETKKACAKTKVENILIIAKENFEKSKKSELERIVVLGNEKKSQIEALNAEIVELEKSLPELREQETGQMRIKNECAAKLAELPIEADLSESEEYIALVQKDTDLAKQIEDAKANGVDTSAIESEKACYESELENLKSQIAKAENNVSIDERISELETEQKEVGQKVADQEKMLYLLEQFIKEKMNKISENINSKFKSVSWKLFENQLNGGMKECCECTVNGVPYSDLNSGHRIVAGLDIISSLSELYGITAPIFVDNAESINEFNLPVMDAQMILLSVSEDKEMVVE